jgi:hypothetical protein
MPTVAILDVSTQRIGLQILFELTEKDPYSPEGNHAHARNGPWL